MVPEVVYIADKVCVLTDAVYVYVGHKSGWVTETWSSNVNFQIVN